MSIALASVAFLSGTSLAKKHITVKSGSALEQIAKTTVCIFDKTGTLTFGRLMATNLKHFCTLFGETKAVSSSNGLKAQDFSDTHFDSSYQASLKDSWTSFKVLEMLVAVEESSGSVHPIRALIQKELDLNKRSQPWFNKLVFVMMQKCIW